MNFVRGERAETIHEVLGCSLSQVYRIARRFVEDGEIGLADRREDNGQEKVDEAYAAEVLRLVAEDIYDDIDSYLEERRKPTEEQLRR